MIFFGVEQGSQGRFRLSQKKAADPQFSVIYLKGEVL